MVWPSLINLIFNIIFSTILCAAFSGRIPSVSWWVRARKAKRMSEELGTDCLISVGVMNDGTIDINIKESDEDDWCFHNLSVSEAEYLHAELSIAIQRQKGKFSKNESKE